MFGEEGFGLYNPETRDWEFPMFVETMLQDFCSPEAANQTHLSANALHIVLLRCIWLFSFSLTSF